MSASGITRVIGLEDPGLSGVVRVSGLDDVSSPKNAVHVFDSAVTDTKAVHVFDPVHQQEKEHATVIEGAGQVPVTRGVVRVSGLDDASSPKNAVHVFDAGVTDLELGIVPADNLLLLADEHGNAIASRPPQKGRSVEA